MAEPGSRLARRRRVLLAVGIAAALLAVGGLIGASFVKSPRQLAADTAAPPPTVTTAAVVSQVLTASVQMRGVVYPATQYDVYPSAPESGTGASGTGASGTGSAAVVSARNLAFDQGWKTVRRASVPVVSVGNITLGGTGKTPMVEWVARWYRAIAGREAVQKGYHVPKKVQEIPMP